MYTLCFISIVCSVYNCPPGSECNVCNETGLPYCEYSCAIDNGGCGEGVNCIEENIPSCNFGECCSPVKINCEGNLCTYTALMYVHT